MILCVRSLLLGSFRREAGCLLECIGIDSHQDLSWVYQSIGRLNLLLLQICHSNKEHQLKQLRAKCQFGVDCLVAKNRVILSRSISSIKA